MRGMVLGIVMEPAGLVEGNRIQKSFPTDGAKLLMHFLGRST